MYSSRRYNYKPKSRQYYRKKKINNKFSPAAYKQNIPTFYQQKGRIIQTTPLRMYDVPTSIPNSQTLDKMFKTLQRANYPGLNTPTFSYKGTYYTVLTAPLKDIFTFDDDSDTDSIQINSTWLKEYLLQLNGRPPLPEGYDIVGDIIFMNFDFPSGTIVQQFSLYYTTPVNDTPISLFNKLNTSTLSTDYTNLSIMLSPRSSYMLNYNNIVFNSTSINQSIQNVTLEHPVATTLEYFPFVSTFDDPTTTYLQIMRNISTADINLYGNISLFIGYRYIESF